LELFVKTVQREMKSEVLRVLTAARAIIPVRILDQGRELEKNSKKIDLLRQCAIGEPARLCSRAGAEGCYQRFNASGLILEFR
jgi:hypothetical protein